jgi:L-rhamnose isomerase/sugar isomerase
MTNKPRIAFVSVDESELKVDAIEGGLLLLQKEFGRDSIKNAIEGVKAFEVEVPSWAFGPFGGGRFGEYMPPGAARNTTEKLDDAALVNRLTGSTPRVATHVLWDLTEDGATGSLKVARNIKALAEQRGLKLGAVSPTYFLRGSHRGSFSADDEGVRKRYIEQTEFAADVANGLGNNLVTLWFPDGSSYPGEKELRLAYRNLKRSLAEASKRFAPGVRFLIEYKLFEPGTYSTTVPDWGTAALLANSTGPNAGVLVDLGHHHHGTNVEQIVATIIEEGIWGGLHFNTRYAADDDHAVEPNPELGRIMYELVVGDVVLSQDQKRNWAFMIDQASPRENRIMAVLHSVDSLQLALARALLVDREELRARQLADDIIGANRLFNEATMNIDVRPLVAKARIEKGAPVDPVGAYVESGYQQKIERERA